MNLNLLNTSVPTLKRLINKHRTIYPPLTRYDSGESESDLSSISNNSIEETPQPYSDEKPPSYQPTLIKKGKLEMKTELSSPSRRAKIRKWFDVDLEVNNTQLKITKYYDKVGMIKKTYKFSLQFAEVGLALDCVQRPYSFRLRIESKQFVFDCPRRDVMLKWTTTIETAIGLSLPLELRQLPEEVPRRRVRRVRTSHSDVSGNVSHNRQDDRIEVVRRIRTAEDQINDQERLNMLQRSHQVSLFCNRFETPKWLPVSTPSRFSFRDFPQLLLNSSWEGMNTLYKGRWARVCNNQINLVCA